MFDDRPTGTSRPRKSALRVVRPAVVGSVLFATTPCPARLGCGVVRGAAPTRSICQQAAVFRSIRPIGGPPGCAGRARWICCPGISPAVSCRRGLVIVSAARVARSLWFRTRTRTRVSCAVGSALGPVLRLLLNSRCCGTLAGDRARVSLDPRLLPRRWCRILVLLRRRIRYNEHKKKKRWNQSGYGNQTAAAARIHRCLQVLHSAYPLPNASMQSGDHSTALYLRGLTIRKEADVSEMPTYQKLKPCFTSRCVDPFQIFR